MDPVAALGLASSVLQVVNFTGGLISKSRQLYQSASGNLVENDELEAVVRTLQSHSRRIAMQLGGQKGKSQSEKDIVALCEGVRELCVQLIDTVESLKVVTNSKAPRWESFRQALRSVWKESEISNLMDRLERYRNQIDSILLANIKDRLEAFTVESGNRDARIEQNLAKILASLKPGSPWQAEIVHATRQSLHVGAIDSATAAVSASLSAGAKQEREKLLERRTLESLKFVDMRDRYERISEAHQKTFEWVFGEPGQSSSLPGTAPGQPFDNFSTWLMSNKPLYWITGKPGAGKSTLMKFLSDDSRLLSHLRVWQRNRPIFTARFFFWNSGTTMQMSQIGLLQSLLHQTVSNFPHEIRRLFPDRWEYQDLFGYDARPWTWSELSQAFTRLVSDPSRAFFFMIDGLDEFHGDCNELADYLLGLPSKSDNIKLCLASRPWLVFEDAFRLQPSLRMEDLTMHDIHLFASERVGDNAMFAQLRRLDEKEALSLIEAVTEKASGVFLWVQLVVKSLLDGLRDGDTVADLQARLLRLPRDLEDLFERILGDLEPEYFAQAAQIFRTVRASHLPWKEIKIKNVKVFIGAEFQTRDNWSPLTLLSLSFIGEDVQLALKKTPNGGVLTLEEQMYRAETTRRRLYSRCKGLLEAPGFARKGPEANVQYLHRTVRDFLEEDRARNFLMSSLSAREKEFDPHLSICAALIRHTKAISPTEDDEMTGMVSFAGLLGEFSIQCHWMEKQGSGGYVPFLVEMDKITEAILGDPAEQDMSMVGGRMVKAHKLPHWTRRVDPDVGTRTPQVESLIDYAIFRGLTHYVRERVAGGYSFETNPNQQFLATRVLENGPQELADVLGLGAVESKEYEMEKVIMPVVPAVPVVAPTATNYYAPAIHLAPVQELDKKKEGRVGFRNSFHAMIKRMGAN